MEAPATLAKPCVTDQIPIAIERMTQSEAQAVPNLMKRRTNR